MTLREEYEDLKYELTARLQDASVISILDCPFDYYMSEEADENYFIRGSRVRVEVKKMLVILDNTYAKSRLFPSDETADMFIGTMEQTFIDFKKTVIEAYKEEPFFFASYSEEEYTEFIDNFIAELREAAQPYIEKLRTTTQHEIELEVRARDNYRKKLHESHFNFSGKKRFGWL